MPAKWRAHRSAELKRKLASEDIDLALTDDATQVRVKATLDRLRELQQRVEQRQLEPADWALLSALLRETK